MFGKFGDIKKRAAELKERLAEKRIERESAGIRLSLDGTKNLKSLHIPDLYLEPARKEELEQKIITLMNEAAGEADAQMKKEMNDLAGPLAGMLGL